MTDSFPKKPISQHSASSAVSLTKSDVTVFGFTRGLYIGGAGDVAVRMRDGNSATFVGALAGTILPIQVDQLLSTGTSATNVLALY